MIKLGLSIEEDRIEEEVPGLVQEGNQEENIGAGNAMEDVD